MRIKVKHKRFEEIMYAVNFTDSGYVICVDYNGEFLKYDRENLQVIDPEYLPNNKESAEVINSLPEFRLTI